MYFGGGDIAQLSRHISWEIGWDTSVGKYSSNLPNSRILNEKNLAAKDSWKSLAKTEFNEFTSM